MIGLLPAEVPLLLEAAVVLLLVMLQSHIMGHLEFEYNLLLVLVL